MSEAVREEFFADPDVRLCGSAHPTGRATEVAGDAFSNLVDNRDGEPCLISVEAGQIQASN